MTAEDPETNLNTTECVLLDRLTRRCLNNLNMERLYAKKRATVVLDGYTYDLDNLPRLVLGIEKVLINGIEYAYSLDGHVLTVDAKTLDATVDIVYVGCNKLPESATDDVNVPSYITDTLLVAGICLEYCKVKGLEYAMGYYAEAYEEGLKSAFRERRNVIIATRRLI